MSPNPKRDGSCSVAGPIGKLLIGWATAIATGAAIGAAIGAAFNSMTPCIGEAAANGRLANALV